MCADTYKAAAKPGKVRYSVDDGVTRRHAVPSSFEEALCHVDSALIWEACLREYNVQVDCSTWEQCHASECYEAGRTPICCKWVFGCKRG